MSLGRRAEPFNDPEWLFEVNAFDLLWAEGHDLRQQPLIRRKLWLRSILPQHGERLLYCSHIEEAGESLFRLACEYNSEGVVAKHKFAPYMPECQTTWLKIRNRSYSQWVGREKLSSVNVNETRMCRVGIHV